VLAALNAVTKQIINVSNDSYINAVCVCELLRKLAAACPGVPITLFLDNARYQKCALVQELAASLKIELAYLPPYSPNLNLIERFWKFVKKRCLYSKYYSEFDAFQAAITDCIESAHTTHRDELKTLLTHNFQSFEDAQHMTV
jgi:transposase